MITLDQETLRKLQLTELEWYENSEEILLEGISFVGIADYEEYLTFKFGDCRELPPVEQRKVHPVSGIELI